MLNIVIIHILISFSACMKMHTVIVVLNIQINDYIKWLLTEEDHQLKSEVS